MTKPHNTSQPQVVIIVLNWNQPLMTIRCVESLQALDYSFFSILVVDNGSADNSVAILRKHFGDTIEIICNSQNQGFSGGNNIGIRHALGKGAYYVLLLNNDTIVERDSLTLLVENLKSRDQIAAANPKIYYMEDQNRIWAVGGNLNLFFGKVGNRGRGQSDMGQFDSMSEIDYGTGCCLLIKSEALRKIGLLNEEYFAYFEDADWSLRAINKGYKILYVPEAKIWHAAGTSSKRSKTKEGTTSPKVQYLNARNHLWFLRSHTKGLGRVTAITGYFIHRITFYSALFLLMRRFEKLKALWRGFRDGLRPVPDPPKV